MKGMKQREISIVTGNRVFLKDLQTVVQGSVAMPLRYDRANHDDRGLGVRGIQGTLSGEQYVTPT